MGEPKWTRGPWRVDSAGLVYDTRNNTVAHGRYSNYLPESEQHANADLIATAPDLAELLEEAVNQAERQAERDAIAADLGVGEWEAFVPEWWHDAFDALAKARGEDQS